MLRKCAIAIAPACSLTTNILHLAEFLEESAHLLVARQGELEVGASRAIGQVFGANMEARQHATKDGAWLNDYPM